MALTRITKGVIKPNEDYSTRHINSTGIVTAIGLDVSGNVSIGGVLTYEDVTSIDSVGIITARDGIDCNGDLDVDGHTNLDNVSVAGVTTFAGNIGGTATFNNIDVDGHTNLDNVSISGVTTITSAAPELHFTDTNANSDYSIVVNTGQFRIRDETNSTNRFAVNSDGHSDFYGRLDANSGLQVTQNATFNNDIDVDGHTNLDNVSIAGVTTIATNTTIGGNLTVNGTNTILNTTTYVQGGEGAAGILAIYADQGDDNADKFRLISNTDSTLNIDNYAGGSWETNIKAVSNGAVELYHNNVKTAFTDVDQWKVYGRTSNSGMVEIASNQGANNNDRFRIHKTSAASRLSIQAYSTGSWVENIRINAGGAVELKHADGTTKAYTQSSGFAVNGNINLYDPYPSITWEDTNHNSDFRITNDDGKLIVYDITRGAHVMDFQADGNVKIPVNSKKLMFGSGNDLQLYADGTDALIDEPNSKRLRVRSTETRFENFTGLEVLGRFVGGNIGRVELYHDGNSKKFETTATGITVTGEVATSQDYPNFQPTLDFNFAATKKLDSRITYRRTGPASFVNEFGKVVIVGDNAPRFDHDPTTRECKGLLIEESRTNLFPYGTTPGDLWNNSKSGTFEENTTETTAPDGTFTATKWTFTNTDPYLYHSQTLSANTSYTVTMWVKAGTNMAGDYVQIRIGAAPYSPNGDDITVPTDGTWKRISYTKTVGGSNETNASVGFEPQVKPSGNPASGDVIYIWGAQLEAGDFETSFIPTNGFTATRGADFVKVEGEEFAEFYNDATEHTTVMIGKRLGDTNTDGRLYTISDGTSSQVAPDWDFNDDTKLRISSNVGGSSQMVQELNPFNERNNEFKIAAGMAVNNQIGVVNGTAIAAADTSCLMPTGVDRLYFGLRGNEGNQGSLTIKRFMFYPKRLPDSQLVTLTS